MKMVQILFNHCPALVAFSIKRFYDTALKKKSNRQAVIETTGYANRILEKMSQRGIVKFVTAEMNHKSKADRASASDSVGTAMIGYFMVLLVTQFSDAASHFSLPLVSTDALRALILLMGTTIVFVLIMNALQNAVSRNVNAVTSYDFYVRRKVLAEAQSKVAVP